MTTVMGELRARAHDEAWGLRGGCAELMPASMPPEPEPLVLSFVAACLHCGGHLNVVTGLAGEGVELAATLVCSDCKSGARVRVLYTNGRLG